MFLYLGGSGNRFPCNKNSICCSVKNKQTNLSEINHYCLGLYKLGSFLSCMRGRTQPAFMALFCPICAIYVLWWCRICLLNRAVGRKWNCSYWHLPWELTWHWFPFFPLPGELKHSVRCCTHTERLLCWHIQVSTAVLSITAKAKKKEKEKEKEKKEEEKMEVVGANIES